MTHNFAIQWAYWWLAAFGIFSLVGIATRMPLPDNVAICLGIGAAWAVLIVGPIVWVSLTRS